jgi:hypothetical protein
MARKLDKKKIEHPSYPEGVIFEVTQEGFATGRALFVRVAKAIGPALAVLADSSAARVAPALKSAAENLSDADLAVLADKFGASTRFSTDGGVKWPYLSAANQEELFAGNLFLFFEWLYFALEVNYADFFDALRARSALGQKGETPDASQKSQNP